MASRTPRRRQQVFVGSKIRHLRKERNLTQSALAQKIGVQQSDLCRMENGEYKVSLDTLFRILRVFDMEIGDFFGNEIKPAAPGERAREMLRLFRHLDDGDRDEVIEFLRYKHQKAVQKRDSRTV